jgi:hypothetical protein
MENLEEWEKKIESREQKILQAFFEYARNNYLHAFYTPYFFAKQILPAEPIVLKYCIIMCLIESGGLELVGEKWIIIEEIQKLENPFWVNIVYSDLYL